MNPERLTYKAQERQQHVLGTQVLVTALAGDGGLSEMAPFGAHVFGAISLVVADAERVDTGRSRRAFFEPP